MPYDRHWRIRRRNNRQACEKSRRRSLCKSAVQRRVISKRLQHATRKFLEQNFAENDRTFWKEKLSIDDCKIFSDAETFMFVKIFGNCAGIFGFGEANGNFKLLSLCFIESKKRFDKQLTEYAFGLFMKTFLPGVATSEIVAVLKENHFFTVAGVIFELVQTGKFNMLNVSIE